LVILNKNPIEPLFGEVNLFGKKNLLGLKDPVGFISFDIMLYTKKKESTNYTNFYLKMRFNRINMLKMLVTATFLYCINIRAQEIRTSYPPAEPSVAFASISSEWELAMTDFVAKNSKLKEAYIWLHREASGIIAAQIVRNGRVLASGEITGKTVGKQRIYFPGDIYLEKGATYYLRLFKGEPATVRGIVARAAIDIDEVQGFDVLGPVTYDLAHELVFVEWTGDPPVDLGFDERKQLPAGYEEAVNEALRSNPDLWGEQVLARPEGPTYDNIKDYLAPLKSVGTRLTESGVYYIPFGRPTSLSGFGPAALHVGDGSQIISQTSVGVKTTIFVGETGQERYGFAEARLAEEYLEGGYYPILVNEYTDVSGIKYTQESFADYVEGMSELVSFVKMTIHRNERTSNVKVVFQFSDENLTQEGNKILVGGKVRAVTPSGGTLIGNRLVYDFDIRNGDCQLYFARLLHPSDHCVLHEVDAKRYDFEKAELKEYWDGELAKGATFEVPEELVVHARKNLLIQNLYHGWLYSIGNLYQTQYQPDAVIAAMDLGMQGFLPQQKAIQEVLLAQPKREYRNWETATQLHHAVQYFRMSGDKEIIDRNRERFINDMADFEVQMNTPDYDGVLKKEEFSGDIFTRLVYLHHQAPAWQGMRDMSLHLKSFGYAEGGKYLKVADTLKSRLTYLMNENITVLPDGSIFIPTEVGTGEKPKPYPAITETRYGSYWNLSFPFAVKTGFLGTDLLPGYYKYLKDYGGLLLGMVRFNYYPVPVGGFHPDGLPGYNTTGVDNIYGPNMAHIFAMMDDPDRLALSFYSKLAHGMTRKTFISGEGDTVGVYPGEYYRSSFLSPSSYNNAWFLLMLRLMLIYEADDRNGIPVKLCLGWFTPRTWLEHGKEIKVADAPTMFGTLDYTVRSEIGKGKVYAMVQIPERTPASEVSLRLRVPGKKTIKSVTVNGKRHKAFNKADETIDLTGKTGQLNIVVKY